MRAPPYFPHVHYPEVCTRQEERDLQEVEEDLRAHGLVRADPQGLAVAELLASGAPAYMVRKVPREELLPPLVYSAGGEAPRWERPRLSYKAVRYLLDVGLLRERGFAEEVWTPPWALLLLELYAARFMTPWALRRALSMAAENVEWRAALLAVNDLGDADAVAAFAAGDGL